MGDARCDSHGTAVITLAFIVQVRRSKCCYLPGTAQTRLHALSLDTWLHSLDER